MSDQWFIKTNSGKRGPYSIQQLQHYVDAGAILPNAGIGDGEGRWVAASSVKELKFSAKVLERLRVAKKRRAAPASDTPSSTASPSVSETNRVSEAPADYRPGVDQRDENLAKLAADLESRRVEVEEKMRALDVRAREIEAMAEEVSQRESAIELQRQKTEDRQAELEAQLARAELLHADASQRVEELEPELHEAEQSLQSVRLQLEQQAAEFESASAAQVETIRDREKALVDAEERLTTAREEIEADRAEFETERAKFESDEARLATERTELETKSTELETKRAELDRRESEVAGRSAELEQLGESLVAREHSIEQNKRSLEEQEAMLVDRESEIVKRHTEFINGQRELETMRDAVARAESQKNDAQDTVRSLQQTVSDLETELKSVQEELGEAETQVETLRREVSGIRSTAQEPQGTEVDRNAVGQSLVSPNADNDTTDHVDEILDEKESLLESFASRQDALSQREAELNRRELELTRRELGFSQVADASEDSLTRRVDRVVEDGPAPEADSLPASDSLADSLAVASEAITDTRPSSWEEVFGWVNRDQHASQSAEDQRPRFSGRDSPVVGTGGESEHDSDEVLTATMSMMEFRRQEFAKRFGPCTEYHEDDDASMRVDVSVHQPDGGRDFATLVTSGMSDYPIPGGQRSVFAELLLYATHVDDVAIQILRRAAKVPFQTQTGLSIGTTESLDQLKGLKGMMQGSNQNDCVYMLPVIESDSKPIAAKELIGSSVQLFWLVTITDAERNLIDTEGIHKFLALMEQNKHAVYFDLMRECYVKRKSWFRR